METGHHPAILGGGKDDDLASPLGNFNAAALSIPEDNRPKSRFTIPESARDKTRDPRTVVLRELSADEMTLAQKLAGGNSAKFANEAVKLSLWAVDGRTVNRGDAEQEAYWSRWSSKVRLLLTNGFGRLHSTTSEEDSAFFDSQTPA